MENVIATIIPWLCENGARPGPGASVSPDTQEFSRLQLRPPQLVSGCVTEKISHGVSIGIQNNPLKMENLSPEQRKKMESWKGEHKLFPQLL